MRKLLWGLLVICGVSVLLCASCPAPTSAPTPTEPPVIEVVVPEPEPTPPPWSEDEANVLAMMLWGEARGVQSDTEKAACVWCVLNRVDAYGASIIEVTTAPSQFVGYQPGNPVDPHLKALCEDVLTRYFAEKNGEVNTGRVLPPDYLYFSGDGVRNHFRNAFRGGEIWDWSLPSPYES